MRFVEGVAAEIEHFFEKRGRSRLVDAVFDAAGDIFGFVAVDKILAFTAQDLGFLFADGAAHDIGAAHRIAAELPEDHHDLFLIQRTAVGDVQDLLERRMLVDHAFGVLFALDKTRDRFHRARTVQRDHRADLFDRLRAHPDRHRRHTCRFQLEHTAGLALGEHLEGRGVVVGDIIHRKRRIAVADHRFGVGNDRQVSEAEEVHLHQADLADRGHRELRDDDVFVDRQRHVRTRFLRRQHDPGGMRRGILGHTLHPHRRIDQLFDQRIIFVDRFQVVGFLQRFFDRDMQLVGHEFSQPVDLRQRHGKGAADVADDAARRHRTKGDDLGDVRMAVAFGHILDHFAAAFGAEVDIEVGHGDAFGV